MCTVILIYSNTNLADLCLYRGTVLVTLCLYQIYLLHFGRPESSAVLLWKTQSLPVGTVFNSLCPFITNNTSTVFVWTNIMFEIWGSHITGYKKYGVLEYDTVV